MFRSLSAKLLMVTVGLVMLAEVLIFVPSVAFSREVWLEDHLASGQIAGLALEANPDATLSRELEAELLANAYGAGFKHAEVSAFTEGRSMLSALLAMIARGWC